MPKIIRIPQQNNKDYFLVNLSSIVYIACNDKAGTCKVFLKEKLTITCNPIQGKVLRDELEKWDEQLDSVMEAIKEGAEF